MPIKPNPGWIAIAEDSYICSFLRRLLQRAGYQSLNLQSPGELTAMRAEGRQIDALITNSPREYRAVASDIPLIYTSSSPDPDATRGFNHFLILKKPFQPAELISACHEVIAAVLS